MLDAEYWDNRYKENETGWDIGGVSRPLIEYLDQVKDTSIKLLFPGAGLAWDAEYAFNKGFINTFVADVSNTAKSSFLKRVHSFPEDQYIIDDIFDLENSFDLILEQTLYCAINPSQREKYANKMFDLLNPGGKLAGVLFTFPLTENGPPFGGSIKEYEKRFSNRFKIKTLENCHNSITPRMGNEAFIILEKSMD